MHKKRYSLQVYFKGLEIYFACIRKRFWVQFFEPAYQSLSFAYYLDKSSQTKGRSQTSEQYEASFERRRRESRVARGVQGHAPRKILKTGSSKMFFKHFPWNFSSEKSILSSQGEAIASFSLMLATALKLLGLLKRSCPMLTKVSMRMSLYLAVV